MRLSGGYATEQINLGAALFLKYLNCAINIRSKCILNAACKHYAAPFNEQVGERHLYYNIWQLRVGSADALQRQRSQCLQISAPAAKHSDPQLVDIGTQLLDHALCALAGVGWAERWLGGGTNIGP
jgi:hypothetical protein